MTLFVFLAVLLAAFLHALWNALIKTGTSKVTGMLIMTVVQGSLGLVIALTRPFPTSEVWPWLIASGLFHVFYKLFLAFAYEQGDLSRVYPIARGAAPLIVTGFSALFLSDQIAGAEYSGIALLGIGIAVMARGAFANGESRRLVPLALGSAVMTAGYSLVDGLGARVAGDAVTFVAWLFALDAALFVPAALALRGRGIVRSNRQDWLLGSVAAIASYGAYAIAVWAMTQAPIALVAALRESSILFAVLIGWLLFGDRMDRTKALAAGLIVAGMALTRV
ncbi:EamA family transporter [Primorskyibacter sp. S87]|uniref:EamA family transporter n=1 Tax=Primorskyibacter sp. S87 TaxID=3415126 RepID=UPI003C7CB1B5